MYLFSTTYIINQHTPRLFQFETTARQNKPKPILLRHLRTIRGVRRRRRPDRGALRRRLSQVQRNELSLFGTAEDRTRKIAPQQHASATKRESRRQRDRAHDNAEQNDVDQQIGD